MARCPSWRQLADVASGALFYAYGKLEGMEIESAQRMSLVCQGGSIPGSAICL